MEEVNHRPAAWISIPLFSESKIHISQLVSGGETSAVTKIISVSRCGGPLFFLVALQKQRVEMKE